MGKPQTKREPVKDVRADDPKGTLDRLTKLAKQVIKAGKAIALFAIFR